MATYDLDKTDAILGRSYSAIEKYGAKGTAYIGKVVMSAGENPVLGRKVVMDVAEPHLILICGKRGGGKCVVGDTLIRMEDGALVPIKDLKFDSRKVLCVTKAGSLVAAPKDDFFVRTVSKIFEITLNSGKKIKLTPEHPLLTKTGWKPVQEIPVGTLLATPNLENYFTQNKNVQKNRTSTMQLVSSTAFGIIWDQLVEIKTIEGETEVFDISVPEHHNFVANDIIIHNSYTLCVMLEELARQPPELRSRISVIAIDTVGIFWTLKIPNKTEAQALFDWGLQPEATNAKVLVPAGKIDFYKKNDIPVDGVFTLKVSELDGVEWLALFKLTWKDADGVLLTRIVELVKERLGSYYAIDDLIRAVQNDTESELVTRQAVVSRLKAAKTWGLLEKDGTKISELARPGQTTIIDVSAYRQAIGMEGTRDIIVALIGKKLFEDRMLFRKEEEAKLIKGEARESKMPIVWMLVDEAHMFMPRDEENIALEVLLEWVRVGRQPGLSLVLATQRPEKLHPDAISQADIFISHRMTSQIDIEAVSSLRPTYMTQSLDKLYGDMPRGKGFALIIDDNTEKIWNVRIRPRFSWDGGVTATAFRD